MHPPSFITTPGNPEAERLRRLHDYGILDTPAEQAYDDFTALACRLLGTPIALISLIDEDRQWFKSKLGLDVASTPRDIPFCAHAIQQSDIFVVPDALQINDTYGHSAGDLLLKKVADRLLTQLRDDDTLARMGGDEMMVLLPRLAEDMDQARVNAQMVGRNLIDALKTPIDLDGKIALLGTSVGITVFPKTAEETAEDLVR